MIHKHYPTKTGSRPAAAARQRGAILVIALLGMVLLAAMVFYVFNVGRHVASRVEVQNAADNAAISGAGWMARSFNTVAMNNVEMSRLIALAGIMDTLPQAVDYTLKDTYSILEAIDAQVQRGVGQDGQWLIPALIEARQTFERQRDILTPLQQLFNESGYDIATMTTFAGPEGQRGELWRSFEALGALNEATMVDLGNLAQQNAFRGAQISQREGGKSAGGLLLPWKPSVPWSTGSFDDFRAPVIDGLLPEDQDDKTTNRGPFDTLFGFWQIRSTATRRDIEVDVEEDYSLTSWAPNPPTQEVVEREPTGYSTWGSYTHMRANLMSLGVHPTDGVSRQWERALDRASDADEHPLVPSLWARRVGFLSDSKINFAYPNAAQSVAVHDPVWINDYEGAQAILEAGEPRIIYGRYLMFEFSRDEYQRGTSTVPTLDAWYLLWPRDQPLTPPSLIKIDDHVWRDERVENRRDAAGTFYQRRYYRYYVFMGANVGPEAEVRNPYNFDGSDRGSLPGPINFTPDQFPPDEATRRESLTFLGIAHQPKEAAFWASAFDGNRADEKLVAIAQAEVFNNHSWDLWTQMWQSQLVPVTGLDQWVKTLAEPENLEEQDWQNLDDLEAVARYLQAVEPLANLMLEH